MSITQSRMIALINAANAFRAAFHDIDAQTTKLKDELDQGLIDAEVAFHALYLYIGPKRIANYEIAQATIETEARHFKRNKRRNERVRLQQERKRRQAGIMPREISNSLEQIAHPGPALAIPPISPTNNISPDRQAVIMAEVEASLRKWHPEIAAQAPAPPQDIAAAMGEAYDPDDPENALAEGQPITPPEAGTDEYES